MGSNCTGNILKNEDFDLLNCDVAFTPIPETKVQKSFNPKFLSQLEQKYSQPKIDDYDLQYHPPQIQTIGARTQKKEKEKCIEIPKGILRTQKSQASTATQKHSVKFQLEEALIPTRTDNRLTRKFEFHSLREKKNSIHFKFTDSYLTLQKQFTSQELE